MSRGLQHKHLNRQVQSLLVLASILLGMMHWKVSGQFAQISLNVPAQSGMEVAQALKLNIQTDKESGRKALMGRYVFVLSAEENVTVQVEVRGPAALRGYGHYRQPFLLALNYANDGKDISLPEPPGPYMESSLPQRRQFPLRNNNPISVGWNEPPAVLYTSVCISLKTDLPPYLDMVLIGELDIQIEYN